MKGQTAGGVTGEQCSPASPLEKLARSTGQSRLFPAKSRLKIHLYFLQNKSCKQKGNRET